MGIIICPLEDTADVLAQLIMRECDICERILSDGEGILRFHDINDGHDYYLCVPCHVIMAPGERYPSCGDFTNDYGVCLNCDPDINF